MPNVKKIIQAHNKRILKKNQPEGRVEAKSCNCKRSACPLDGACLTSNVIYEAKVTTGRSSKLYIGSTGNTFKSRFYSHTHSFNHKGKNETELAKYIWSLKDNNISYELTWRMLKHIPEGGRAVNGICRNCNEEKQAIAMAPMKNLLNSRSELNSMCPHFKKLYFKRIPEEKYCLKKEPRPPT